MRSLTPFRVSRVAVAVAALAASAGCTRAAPRTTVCGEVVDDNGAPVAAAFVQVVSSGATATTDEQGRFCLPAGAPEVTLEVRAPAICDAPPTAAVAAGRTQIRVSRRLFVPSAYQVGFGAEVMLAAELRCPPPEAPSFLWEQTAGPAVVPIGGESGWTVPTLRFETPPLIARTTRPDVLALGPADAGRFRFRLTVRFREGVLQAEAEVTAAPVQSGLLSVPTDTDLYLDAGRGRSNGAWIIESRPHGSTAELRRVPTADGEGGVVRIRPDLPGAYEVREESSGTRLVIQAGGWDVTPRDCHRPECHPGEQSGWERSPHARALDARLETPGGMQFGGACLRCHSVGYDPGAASGGFDDVAAAIGFTVRDGLPGGAGALPRDLRRVANVWCLACHGPGRLPHPDDRSMILRASVCAQCHENASPPGAEPARDDWWPRARVVEEWKTSAMARPVVGERVLGPECAGCHTAQGAVARFRGRILTKVDADLVEPVTCAVCHVAHTGEPGLLRRTGTVATVSGALPEGGRGAVCVDCHQSGRRPDASAEAERLAPISPQIEMIFGRGVFVSPGPAPEPPLNLCVACHMAEVGEETDPERRFGGHTFRAAPAPRRAPEDCDGDGTAGPLGDEIDECLAKVGEMIRRALDALPGCAGARIASVDHKLRPVDSGGAVLPECEAVWLLPEQTPLYRAAYHHAFVERDRSRGAHNPAFAIRILRSVIESLESSGAADPEMGAGQPGHEVPPDHL